MRCWHGRDGGQRLVITQLFNVLTVSAGPLPARLAGEQGWVASRERQRFFGPCWLVRQVKEVGQLRYLRLRGTGFASARSQIVIEDWQEFDVR